MVIDDQFGEIIRKGAVDLDGASKNYAHRVHISGPSTIFGDFSVSSDLPVVQIDALSGLLSVHETFTATGGSVTWKKDHGGREFECATGTNVGGYGLIRSKRAVRYRPGQGVKLRFTARFSAPVALGAQRAGGIASGTELSFGYDGTSFGILWRTAGRQEIRTLTLSVAASGAETATITLDGTAYNVAISNVTTAANAATIAASSLFGSDKAWQAHQNGSTVVFIKSAVGTATGSYSYSSTGTSAGSIAQAGAGSAVSDNWIYSEDWDNPTPFLTGELDPSKGNVYQIEYGYLGYSGIRFFVMDKQTNNFILVHTIKYPNTYQVPHLDNPKFKIGWFAASLGSTTEIKTWGASAAGFISGQRRPFRNPIGHAHTKTGITTTLTNILSIRNRSEFGGLINLAEIIPQLLTAAVDGTKPAVIEVHINATLGGTPNWAYHEINDSIVELDTAATTVTGDREVVVVALGKVDTTTIRLAEYDIFLNRDDVITIAAKATSATTDVTVGLTWLED